MRRNLLVILTVAAISGWINRAELAAGDPQSRVGWVRTTDGWESRAAVAPNEQTVFHAIHPGLVATFQLTASLFVLIALPGRAMRAFSTAPAAPAPTAAVRRPTRRVLAANR